MAGKIISPRAEYALLGSSCQRYFNFGPVLERQTYRHALYLLISFPLGIVYFVTLIAGLSAGVGTMDRARLEALLD